MGKNLRKAIEELKAAKQEGAKQAEEERRRERVIEELEAVEAERRRAQLLHPDDNRSPIQRARDEGDLEAIAEFEWLDELDYTHWRGGGMVHSNLDENPRCISQTAKDTRCKNAARIGSEYCDRHSPEQAELRSEAARRAAATRKMGNLTLSQEASEIKARLRTLTQDLLAEEVSPSIAAVVVQAENAILRAVETERRVTELEELIPVVEELSEDLRRSKGSKGTGRW